MNIRTMETTDGLYVNLSDIVRMISRLYHAFPSAPLGFLVRKLKHGKLMF